MAESGALYATGGTSRTLAASNFKPALVDSIGVDRLSTYFEGITSFTYPNVPAGRVTVELHFADPASIAAGQRIFDVRVNGALYLKNFDIWNTVREVGRELVEKITVTHPGGGLVVATLSSVGLSILNDARGLDGTGVTLSTIIDETPPPVGTTTTVDDTNTGIVYAGAWGTSSDTDDGGSRYGTTDHYSSTQGSTASASFTLTATGSIAIRSKKASHHGKMAVALASNPVVLVDQFNPTDQYDTEVWNSGPLPAGVYPLVATVSGQFNPSSGGSVVELDRFVVTNGDITPAPAGGGGGSGGTTPTGFLTRSGKTMMLNGSAIKFPGMNWDTIQGCWTGEKEAAQASSNAAVHRYFSQSPHTSVTRIWCMPGSDLTWMDTIVGIAEANNQMVSIVLFNGNADCSSISPPSYAPGTNSDELAWIVSVCSRSALKNSKAIAWWEIINEPNGNDANCKSFLDEMAAAIKVQDPNHMIASGTMPEYTFPSHAAYVAAHSGPNIDIVMWSSYSGDFSDWGPQAVAAGAALNKPAVCREKGTCCGGATTGTYAGDAQVLTSWMTDFLNQDGVSCMQWWDFKLVHPEVVVVSFDTPMWTAWTNFTHPSMG